MSEPSSDKATNTLTVAVITAGIAILGNMLAAWQTGVDERRVELMKAEQALVLEAIKTDGDTSKAEENLRFLASAGLLGERGPAIVRALEGGATPSLPTANAASSENLAKCFRDLNIFLPGESWNSPITRSMLRTFQRRNGIPETGMRDDKTIQKARELCS